MAQLKVVHGLRESLKQRPIPSGCVLALMWGYVEAHYNRERTSHGTKHCHHEALVCLYSHQITLLAIECQSNATKPLALPTPSRGTRPELTILGLCGHPKPRQTLLWHPMMGLRHHHYCGPH